MGPEDVSLLPKAAEGRFVWGTYPAIDFCRWQSSADALAELKDIGRARICFPASGDLRHLVRTVANLPDGLNLPVEVHMNDREPFVVARNWLILLLLYLKGEEALDTAVAVWYSSKLTFVLLALVSASKRDSYHYLKFAANKCYSVVAF